VTAFLLDTLGQAPDGAGRGVDLVPIPHAGNILAGVLLLATLTLLAWWELRKEKP
jgi:hypothetical protein